MPTCDSALATFLSNIKVGPSSRCTCTQRRLSKLPNLSLFEHSHGFPLNTVSPFCSCVDQASSVSIYTDRTASGICWLMKLLCKYEFFLISNFRRVLNVVFFLLGNSPASEFYMPTLRNILFYLFLCSFLVVEVKYS